MHTIPVAQDSVHAKPAVARLPLAGVLVLADARNHLPGIAAVAAPEQRRWFDPAPQVFLPAAGFKRPDVGERASVVLGEGGSRLRLLERFPEIGRAQDLHAEIGIAARRVDSWSGPCIDQPGVDRHACAERAAQREAASSLRRLGHEQSLLGANGEKNSVCHIFSLLLLSL